MDGQRHATHTDEWCTDVGRHGASRIEHLAAQALVACSSPLAVCSHEGEVLLASAALQRALEIRPGDRLSGLTPSSGTIQCAASDAPMDVRIAPLGQALLVEFEPPPGDRDARLAALARLASGVARDMEAMLSTIQLYADHALASPATDASYVEAIKAGATAANQVVEQLLAFSTATDATEVTDLAGALRAHAPLTVEDDGEGMPAAVRAQAFDPFFTTRGDRHDGLGLSVVHGLVRSAGGEARIDSRPGGGTQVILRLPIVPAGSPPERPRDQGRGQVVLVVDDEPELLGLIELMLLENGYDAIAAPSAAAALALLDDADPPCDLLLTDVVMPGMTGTELAARVRHRRPDLPVLLMTGHMRVLQPVEALPFPVLTKPFRLPDLLAALRGLLDESQPSVSSWPQ